MRLLLVVIAGILGTAVATAQPGPYQCYQDIMAGITKGGGTLQVNGFTIEVWPDPDSQAWLCHAAIRSPKGDTVFKADDWGLDIDPVTGTDINNDGQPDAIVEAFSGGAHCCFTYFFVSLGPQAGLVKQLNNEMALSFDDLDRDGRMEVLLRDGAFDYFLGSHAESPFPLRILRLVGDSFRDVSSEFLAVYDKEIADLRKQLLPTNLARLRSGGLRGDDLLNCPDTDCIDRIRQGYSQTKHNVLLIVLDYLYSARPTEAWNALDKLWGPDEGSIRSEILQVFCNAIRRHVEAEAPAPCRTDVG